jgi:hypothetical protein
MSLEEYFGDWLKVIDKKILYETINTLNSSNTVNLCPNYNYGQKYIKKTR